MSQERDSITIRAIKADDWHDLYEIWTDPRVCRGLLQVPYQSEDEIRKKVENQQIGSLHRQRAGHPPLREVRVRDRRHQAQVRAAGWGVRGRAHNGPREGLIWR